MNVEFFAYSGLVNAITSFSLAAFVLVKNFKSSLAKSFSAFALSVCYWALNYYFWLSAKEMSTALFFIRHTMVGAILIVNGLLEHERFLNRKVMPSDTGHVTGKWKATLV